MARYLVTSSSHFEPLTYDELVKPLAQMTEAHNNAQAAYDQISLETNALENYISNNPEDTQARALYDNYKNKLLNLQQNLWNNGYTTQTASDLSAARAGYASDVLRLQKAVQARQERSNAYWTMRHNNPDMVAGEDPGLSGLDNYLANDRYGLDYYNYSGKQLTAEVAADAQARMKEYKNSELVKDPKIAGYISRIDRVGYLSEEVDAAGDAAEDILFNGADAKKKLDSLEFPVRVLAEVLLSHMEATGAERYGTDANGNRTGNLSAKEYRRLFNYAKDGLSPAIGTSEIKDFQDVDLAYQRQREMQDRQFKHDKDMENLRFQHQQAINNQLYPGGKSSGSRTGRNGAASSSDKMIIGPNMIELRGNNMVPKDPKMREKYDALNFLVMVNDLKKVGGMTVTDDKTGKVDWAQGVKDGLKSMKNNEYYRELIKNNPGLLRSGNIDAIIDSLANEVNGAIDNNHWYYFKYTEEGAHNVAMRLFKPNIGSLSGKDAKKAESIAHYSNGDKVKAGELLSLLDDKNLGIGFDGKTGEIILQRQAGSDSDNPGKYDDRQVRIKDLDSLLVGASAYVNLSFLLDAFDAALPAEVTTGDADIVKRKILGLSTIDRTVDLRQLAKIITSSYTPLMENGDAIDKAVYNALVDALAQGIYDSGNTSWKPNDYNEGWTAQAPGDFLSLYRDAISNGIIE